MLSKTKSPIEVWSQSVRIGSNSRHQVLWRKLIARELQYEMERFPRARTLGQTRYSKEPKPRENSSKGFHRRGV